MKLFMVLSALKRWISPSLPQSTENNKKLIIYLFWRREQICYDLQEEEIGIP